GWLQLHKDPPQASLKNKPTKNDTSSRTTNEQKACAGSTFNDLCWRIDSSLAQGTLCGGPSGNRLRTARSCFFQVFGRERKQRSEPFVLQRASDEDCGLYLRNHHSSDNQSRCPCCQGSPIHRSAIGRAGNSDAK